MYVCICKVVTQSRVRAVIEAGASSVDEVTEACGAGGDCGSCRDEIESMLDETHGGDCSRCPRRVGRGAASSSAAR